MTPAQREKAGWWLDKALLVVLTFGSVFAASYVTGQLNAKDIANLSDDVGEVRQDIRELRVRVDAIADT